MPNHEHRAQKKVATTAKLNKETMKFFKVITGTVSQARSADRLPLLVSAGNFRASKHTWTIVPLMRAWAMAPAVVSTSARRLATSRGVVFEAVPVHGGAI